MTEDLRGRGLKADMVETGWSTIEDDLPPAKHEGPAPYSARHCIPPRGAEGLLAPELTRDGRSCDSVVRHPSFSNLLFKRKIDMMSRSPSAKPGPGVAWILHWDSTLEP